MVLSEFISSAETVHQLQLPTFPERSRTILDAKGNVEGEMEVLEREPVDTAVYHKPRHRINEAAARINRKSFRRAI